MSTAFWHRVGAVLPPLSDVAQCGEPNVFFDDNPQLIPSAAMVFKMWYSGGPIANRAVYYAESIDGLNWVAHPDPVCPDFRCTVLKVGGEYLLYSIVFRHRWRSTDGLSWSLDPQLMFAGAPAGVWEGSDWANVHVGCEAAGNWWMIYEAGTGDPARRYSIGLMTSADGLNWLRHSSAPVIPGGPGMVGGPWVVKVGATYHLFAHFADTGLEPTDIGRWQSPDLITWTRLPRATFRRQSHDEGFGTHMGQVADATIVEVYGRTYLFYGGQNNTHAALTLGRFKLAICDLPLAEVVACDTFVAHGDPYLRNIVLAGDLVVPGSVQIGETTRTANPKARLSVKGKMVASHAPSRTADFYSVARFESNHARGVQIIHANNPAADAGLTIDTNAPAALKTVSGPLSPSPKASTWETDGVDLYFTNAAGLRRKLVLE